MSGLGTLVPAYGRDYRSQKEVQAAWDEGKDFEITSVFHPDCGRVCNKGDIKDVRVMVRYNKLQRVMEVKNG